MGHHLVTIKARDELFMDYQRLTVINGCFSIADDHPNTSKRTPFNGLYRSNMIYAALHSKRHPSCSTAQTAHSRLDTPHFTLHTLPWHFTLHTSHYTLCSKLPTLHSELLTSHPTHWTRYTTRKSCARLPRLFACRSYKIGMFLQVPDEPQNLPPQNRCFVRGFRQFSSHVTKCHVCHVICAVSPLHSARQCDSQKIRNTTRLKCCVCHAKWTWTPPKVLRLPRKIQLMFREPRKSIAPVTQNDFWIFSTLSHTQCGRCREMYGDVM